MLLRVLAIVGGEPEAGGDASFRLAEDMEESDFEESSCAMSASNSSALPIGNMDVLERCRVGRGGGGYDMVCSRETRAWIRKGGDSVD